MEYGLLWLGIAVVTGMAGAARGRSGFGWFLLGLLFSLLALVAVIVMPSANKDPNAPTPYTHVRCPECKELVLNEARVCKHCGGKQIPLSVAVKMMTGEPVTEEPPWRSLTGEQYIYAAILLFVLALPFFVH